MPDTDHPGGLEDNEVLIYVREPAQARPTADAASPRPALPWEPTLRKVEISDDELDRLRRQVSWIAGRLDLAFHVDDFWPSAILGALLVGVVSWLLNMLVPDGGDD